MNTGILWILFFICIYRNRTQEKLVCCNCESIALTLAQAELWPATPTNPRCAFSFNMLNLVEALLLECQVSLKDFCSALKFYCLYFFSK